MVGHLYFERFYFMLTRQEYVEIQTKGVGCTCNAINMHSHTCQQVVSKREAAARWIEYIGGHPLTVKLIDKLKNFELKNE